MQPPNIWEGFQVPEDNPILWLVEKNKMPSRLRDGKKSIYCLLGNHTFEYEDGHYPQKKVFTDITPRKKSTCPKICMSKIFFIFSMGFNGSHKGATCTQGAATMK